MDHLHHPREDWVHAKLYQIFIQIISTRSNVYSGEFYIIYLVVFWDRGLYQFVFSWPDAEWLLWEKYIISFTFLHELETYLLRGMKRHSSRWWVFATINHTRFPYCRKTAGSATGLCFVRGFKFQMTSFYMLWKFQYLSSVHITVPFFLGGGGCFKAESNVILIINWNTKLSILVSEVSLYTCIV